MLPRRFLLSPRETLDADESYLAAAITELAQEDEGTPAAQRYFDTLDLDKGELAFEDASEQETELAELELPDADELVELMDAAGEGYEASRLRMQADGGDTSKGGVAVLERPTKGGADSWGNVMASKSTKIGGDEGSNDSKSENVSTTDQNGLISPETWDSLFGDADAADARDKFNKIEVRSAEKIKHGFACFPDKSELARNVKRVPPIQGYYDVGMHGSPFAVSFGGEEANMSPRTLARVIRSRPDFVPGEKIRLLCCSTGEIVRGDYCFAEEVANALGVEVMAPDTTLYINNNGGLSVGLMGSGKFVYYKPNERRRRR